MLKLSGEALSLEGSRCYDEAKIREIALQIKEAKDENVDIGIVIGISCLISKSIFSAR